jgi:hypothetical protein
MFKLTDVYRNYLYVNIRKIVCLNLSSVFPNSNYQTNASSNSLKIILFSYSFVHPYVARKFHSLSFNYTITAEHKLLRLGGPRACLDTEAGGKSFVFAGDRTPFVVSVVRC